MRRRLPFLRLVLGLFLALVLAAACGLLLVRTERIVVARGTLRGVSLVPPDAVSSPLGRCILQVARTTRFPRTGRALAFRIPVRLRME